MEITGKNFTLAHFFPIHILLIFSVEEEDFSCADISHTPTHAQLYECAYIHAGKTRHYILKLLIL